MKPQRIDQFLPSYAPYDAIGTHVSGIQRLLRERGFQSEIYRDIVHPLTAKQSHSVREYRKLDHPRNLVVHHFSTGSKLPQYLLECRCFRVTDYHNITPAVYFSKDDQLEAFHSCLLGYRQMPLVRSATDYCWADSQYNSTDLQSFGFSKAEVLPILRDYKQLATYEPDFELDRQLSGPRKNILFVGRVNSNKAIHDLIIMLKGIKAFISSEVRLLVVGHHDSSYAQRKLRLLASKLGLSFSTGNHELKADFSKDIVLPGSVSEQQLATYYRKSQLFLCLSDHEGFCVPLVEAMFFGLPVIAHRATVIPETCGDGAILIDKNNPRETLAAIKAVLSDTAFVSQLTEAALRHAEWNFSWPSLEKRFDSCLELTLENFRKARHQN